VENGAPQRWYISGIDAKHGQRCSAFGERFYAICVFAHHEHCQVLQLLALLEMVLLEMALPETGLQEKEEAHPEMERRAVFDLLTALC